MKHSSLITALTLSTILSACGGGGGGNVPATTLPNIQPTAGCSNPETCMTVQSFSNSGRRIQLYENAQSGASEISTLSLLRAPQRAASSEKVNQAYESMKHILIDENLSGATDEELTKALLLSGYSAEELSEHQKSGLSEWAKRNKFAIKARAQKIYDMYGTEKNVTLENAKLTMVNMDAKQDSYVNFKVDANGKITGLTVNADTLSPDARDMTLSKAGDATFTRTGPSYICGIKLGPDSEKNRGIELELFETPSEDNMDKIRQMLVAAVYEEFIDKNPDYNDETKDTYDDYIKNTALPLIDGLTLDDLKNSQKGFYLEGSDNQKTTITYKSYAKDIGENGLQYTDFGTLLINAKEGNMDVNETFVFAGGYDAKRLEKQNQSGEFNFEGKAVAAVVYQQYSSDGEDRDEKTKTFDGSAKLTFNNGQETLTTNFDNWYDVTVTSNNSNNYDIKFSGGDKIAAEDASHKFDNTEFTKDNFIGDYKTGGADDSYGAADIGYYGDAGNPSEAAGYIAYGEHINGTSTELNAQIGFGLQRN